MVGDTSEPISAGQFDASRAVIPPTPEAPQVETRQRYQEGTTIKLEKARVEVEMQERIAHMELDSLTERGLEFVDKWSDSLPKRSPKLIDWKDSHIYVGLVTDHSSLGVPLDVQEISSGTFRDDTGKTVDVEIFIAQMTPEHRASLDEAGVLKLPPPLIGFTNSVPEEDRIAAWEQQEETSPYREKYWRLVVKDPATPDKSVEIDDDSVRAYQGDGQEWWEGKANREVYFGDQFRNKISIRDDGRTAFEIDPMDEASKAFDFLERATPVFANSAPQTPPPVGPTPSSGPAV